MYAIVPTNLLNSFDLAPKSFFIYSNKALVISELDTLKYKIRQIALLAADDQRGCVIDSHPHNLIELCRKYGGVVQCLRTGQKIYVQQNGEALSRWTLVGKPYIFDTVSHYKGVVEFTALDETYEAPIVHLTNGRSCVTFVRHITDIPEIVALLKQRTYRA